MKKILLTGANGLVGREVSADIRFNGRADVDLRDWDQTYFYFNKHKPTHVIHCAAKVGGVLANMKYPAEFFRDSMEMNLNVLEASRLVGVEKVVSFLSTCIYPDKIEYPLTESNLHSGEPHESNFAYAYAKRMLEVQSRAYRKQYGLNYICVVPTNIYGPHDNFNLEDGHVIPSLIHKCYLAKENNTDFVIWGSGNPLREFVYSSDMGYLIDWALDNYEEETPLILSNSTEVTIKSVALQIAKALEFRGDIVFDASKPEGQLRKPTDNSKLKILLPSFEFTSLEKGIELTVRWFRKNYKVCRK